MKLDDIKYPLAQDDDGDPADSGGMYILLARAFNGVRGDGYKQAMGRRVVAALNLCRDMTTEQLEALNEAMYGSK